MISLKVLAALDCYLWLEHGYEVAIRLKTTQSTISRHIRSALKELEIELYPAMGFQHSELRGDITLLVEERRVHQLARLRGKAEKRIEANYWSGPIFLDQISNDWITGTFSIMGMNRPLQLLKDRVIDAWIGSYQPDLPDNNSDWWVLDLLTMPVHILVSSNHPLARIKSLTKGDLDAFPSLALPEGWFPKSEAILRNQGLWSDTVRKKRYNPSIWEGRCEDDVTMSFGHSLSQTQNQGLVRLDWDLGLTSGEALVVRRDLQINPEINKIAEYLQNKAQIIATQHDDVDLA